jgi:thiol-disulfide isomerase/thioredoxin
MTLSHKISIFSIVLTIFLFVVLVNQILKKNKENIKISKIPYFNFSTLDNDSFNNENIDNSKNRLILNNFSPACEHCQYMAVEFLKDSQKIKDIQILMITTADYESSAKFSNDYKLSLLQNVMILRDTDYQFQKIFGTSFIPSFYIYENNKLVKKIIGETKIENLIYQ